ncbi:MAG: hypothetical protein SF029_14980 [bacterium]|nr:hypothetical protein [bacterium]
MPTGEITGIGRKAIDRKVATAAPIELGGEGELIEGVRLAEATLDGYDDLRESDRPCWHGANALLNG